MLSKDVVKMRVESGDESFEVNVHYVRIYLANVLTSHLAH